MILTRGPYGFKCDFGMIAWCLHVLIKYKDKDILNVIEKKPILNEYSFFLHKSINH